MEFTKRQNEIIDAALKLTAEKGIQNMTVKNLSLAIGVSEAALYRHFKSKGQIVAAMIERFDHAVPAVGSSHCGMAALTEFARSRIEQVCNQPDLARVMFAEELFMDVPQLEHQMFQMMQQHKKALEVHFKTAQKNGEIRSDISPEMLFRIMFAPVRLLIKQWGLTHQGFDLRAKGEELLEILSSILKPQSLSPKSSRTTKQL